MAPNIEGSEKATLVDSQELVRVKCSGPWYSYLRKPLWFYLSFSLGPAFHRYSQVPCPCMHSEMMPGRVVNCSIHVTQEADGVSTEWGLHLA